MPTIAPLTRLETCLEMKNILLSTQNLLLGFIMTQIKETMKCQACHYPYAEDLPEGAEKLVSGKEIIVVSRDDFMQPILTE